MIADESLLRRLMVARFKTWRSAMFMIRPFIEPEILFWLNAFANRKRKITDSRNLFIICHICNSNKNANFKRMFKREKINSIKQNNSAAKRVKLTSIVN